MEPGPDTRQVRRARQVRAGPRAPSLARAWVTEVIDARLPPDRLDDLRFVVSELVTNSVLHAGLAAGAPIRLTLEVSAARVVLSVRDGGRGLLLDDVRPRPGEARGRGLGIVARLSTRLLVDPSGGVVTIEMATAPEAS